MKSGRFKGVLLSALMITSIIALAIPLLSTKPVHAALTPHAPLYIDGNSGEAPSTFGYENTPTISTIYPSADIFAEYAQYWICGPQLKFDISDIPPGATILSAELWLYTYHVSLNWSGQTWVCRVDNQEWDESITCGEFDAQICTDREYHGDIFMDIGWDSLDVLDQFMVDYNAGHAYTSLRLDPGEQWEAWSICNWDLLELGSGASYVDFYSREHAGENYDPYLKITYVYIPRGISISPRYQDGLPGTVQSFIATVTNTRGITNNYMMTLGDNSGWFLTLSGDNLTVDNKIENMSPGENRQLMLTVTIPNNAPIDTRDNVWVKATSMDNENVTDTDSCIVHCVNTISAATDAFVNDAHPDNSYNTLNLRVSSWTRGDYGNMRTFIKFPLDGIPDNENIASAKVWLYCSNAYADDLDAQICGVDNDNWSENEITWNNQPSIRDPLDTQTLSSSPITSANIWITWEVRDFVSGQRLVDNIASFCIKAEVENTSGDYWFYSKEWWQTELCPYLQITFGDVQRAVSLSISPVHRIGDNGAIENYAVNVMNMGNAIDNFVLTSTDNSGWTRTFDNENVYNVLPGTSVTRTLRVTIPVGATPGALDNIKVTATGTGGSPPSDSENCSASVNKKNSWVVAGYAPTIDNYGVAVTGAGNYIYMANSKDLGTRVNFMRYDPTAGGSWTYLATPAIDTPFKSGTVLAWDKGNYIYALLGGAYGDNADNSRARHYFSRYNIATNTWENLKGTGNTENENIQTGAQGSGDALAVVGSYVYAIVGNKYIGSTFWKYTIVTNTWSALALPTAWSGKTDDGCSLVWTGGDYLYAFQGQSITTDNSFYRYSIPGISWTKMADAPAGVDDGGSLLWMGGDNIYALLGGNPSTGLPIPNNENNRDNCFYVYSQAGNSWTKLENLPKGIGDPNGQRLGKIGSDKIYAWRGPSNNTSEYSPVLWVYTAQYLFSGTVSIALDNLYSVTVNINGDFGMGSKFVAKFYTYGGGYQDNTLVNNENIPGHVTLNKHVSRPTPTNPIQRIDLVVTDSGGTALGTVKTWATSRTVHVARIGQINGLWPFLSEAQRTTYVTELGSINGLWPFSPEA